MATFKAKDGTQIYYKDCGAGKPVLFSHGWPLDGDMWDSQLNFLAERGYRTIAFDRRGFGRSDQPWNGYDYDTFASDINDLITTLDLRDVTLVGFSMGGGDVTRYINNYGSERAAGLALLGAVTPIFGKSESYPEGVDQSVFSGIRDGLRKDRAQFISDFATPFYGTNAGQTVSAGALTQTLNIALLASLKRHRYATDNPSATTKEALLDKLITRLAGSLNKSFVLEKFCEQEQCSERALRQQFRTQTGMTVNHYLRQLRICHAQYLLQHTELMVSEVAMRCGFEDSNYFSVVFNREVGMTPVQWRHRSRKAA